MCKDYTNYKVVDNLIKLKNEKNLKMKPNMAFVNEQNMCLLTDLYQLTMAAGFFYHNMNNLATYDFFVRKSPSNGSYLLVAGLEQLLGYLEDLKFGEKEIEYLRKKNLFSETFLNYLLNFKFGGEVYAMPEGTIAFPNEPLVRVTASRIEAQIIETFLLNQLNFQTLIATKASRVVYAASGKSVVDFGLRRAQSESAAVKGLRACYIGGCSATSNVLAGYFFDIPVSGTQAHAWVMSFDDEVEAFEKYTEVFPANSVFLIDTYNTEQGAKNTVVVAKKMEAFKQKLKGVRLDSGDLCTLSKNVRRILDEAGLEYVTIFASNDLNEYKISELLKNGARIDGFGVGTELITSKPDSALGGVYKLSESTNKEGILAPKLKISEEEAKTTLPGRKQVYRISNYEKDVIALDNEKIGGQPLLMKVMEKGKIICDLPTLQEIRQYASENLSRVPDRYKFLKNAPIYPVEISPKLKSLQDKLIQEIKKWEV